MARVKLLNGQPTEPERLYELFHENTKHFWSQNREIGERIGRYLQTERSIRETAANYKTYRLLPRINLPTPSDLPEPLSSALAKRVSVRQFAAKGVPIEALSNVLFHSFGCNRSAQSVKHDDVQMRFRSYPSGGGLYPVEIYPVLLRVDDTPATVTHYDPRSHHLSVIGSSVDIPEFEKAFLGNDSLLQSAGLLILMTGVFERSIVKYGDRGYRLCLLEAGHAAQNLCLTAVAQGLGTLVFGGFDDNAVASWLGIDAINEAVVHAIFVGHATEYPDSATQQ